MVPLLIIILPILMMALAAINNKTDSQDTKNRLQEMIIQLKQMNKPL